MYEASKSAKLFNCQITPHSTDPDREVCLKFADTYGNLFTYLLRTLTPSDVTRAIRGTRSWKALDPDGKAPLHLKKLGPRAVEYLTNVINLSLTSL